jgi:hypothetical protein
MTMLLVLAMVAPFTMGHGINTVLSTYALTLVTARPVSSSAARPAGFD